MCPYFCNYYVTLRCNSKCQFCGIWRKEENFSLQESGMETVKNNLRDLKKLGVKLIDYTGGEPLLYPHLIDALKEAKKMGFYTTITTNCLLYPKYAKDLAGLVDVMQFSFESVDEETHNQIRGVKSYKNVLESIEIAKKLKQKVYLIHTVTDENYSGLAGNVSFAQKNRCIIVLNPCFGYFDNKGVSKKAVEEIRKYRKEPYVLMDEANLKLIEHGGNDINKPICKAVSSTIVISPDNYLLLPCYHRHNKKIKINDNLSEIYNSREVKEIKKMDGRYEFCKNCTIYCYMRGSLYTNVFSRYFPLTARSAIKHLGERTRKQ
ncbi:MAG: radical SAM protein [Candidatus Altiarchaeia archaeon]